MSRKAVARFLFAFIVLVLALVGAGCGADVLVETQIRPDLTGIRTFKITVADSDLQQVGLTPEQLLNILNSDKPSFLSKGIMQREQGQTTITFREEFSGLQELKNHSQALTGHPVDIKLGHKGSPFVLEYFYSDPTPPADYVEWAKEALDKRSVAREYKSSWISNVQLRVYLPGRQETYSDKQEIRSKLQVPLRETVVLLFNPLLKRGKLTVWVDVPEEVARNMDKNQLLAFLGQGVPGVWGERKLGDNFYRYSTAYPVSGTLQEVLTKPELKIFDGAAVSWEPQPQGIKGLFLHRAFATIKVDPVRWLGSEDVSGVMEVAFGPFDKVSLRERHEQGLQELPHSVEGRTQGEKITFQTEVVYPSYLFFVVLSLGAILLLAGIIWAHLKLRLSPRYLFWFLFFFVLVLVLRWFELARALPGLTLVSWVLLIVLRELNLVEIPGVPLGAFGIWAGLTCSRPIFTFGSFGWNPPYDWYPHMLMLAIGILVASLPIPGLQLFRTPKEPLYEVFDGVGPILSSLLQVFLWMALFYVTLKAHYPYGYLVYALVMVILGRMAAIGFFVPVTVALMAFTGYGLGNPLTMAQLWEVVAPVAVPNVLVGLWLYRFSRKVGIAITRNMWNKLLSVTGLELLPVGDRGWPH